jgi:hypothetical protein
MAVTARQRRCAGIAGSATAFMPASGGHLQTGLRAGSTCLRALLAVFVLVSAALFSAGFTDIHAHPAQRLQIVILQRHKLPHQPTERRALEIQFDALTHHGHVLFIQTTRGTMFAGNGALVTGIATGFMFGLHKFLLLLSKVLSVYEGGIYANY